jgi:FixJ family two-component response regulator
VLLTDIVMPDGVSGWELAKRLQSDKAGLSVIYTSGYSPDFVDEDGRFLEGRVFLQKPYNPETLVDKIRACISGK